MTPLEVLEGAREQVPALSIATVYRNIKSLLQDGAIHRVPLPGDNPRYESNQAASTHHHHFQCTLCQRVFDVHDCPGDLKHMAPEGFSVERHELTFYGHCADCIGNCLASRGHKASDRTSPSSRSSDGRQAGKN